MRRSGACVTREVWLQRNRGARGSVKVGLVVVFTLLPTLARAQTPSPSDPRLAESLQVCLDDHEAGQEQRALGDLASSYRAFGRCGDSSCPDIVRSDCSLWMRELTDKLALTSVVVWVNGQVYRKARIVLNGKPLETATTGQPVPLAEASYRLEVTVENFDPQLRQVQVEKQHLGQLRTLRFTFNSPPPAPITPKATYWLGGLGLAGIGAFAALGVSSRQLQSDLENRCAPNCPSSDVDTVRQRALLANVSLGVGVTSLLSAAAAYLWFPEFSRSNDLTVAIGFADHQATIVQARFSAF